MAKFREGGTGVTKLTHKQRAFITAFLVSRNATRAALEAGYAKPSARQSGYACMKNPHIRGEINRREREAAERADVTKEEVLRGLRAIAEDENVPPAARVSAWTQLGKTIAMFTDKVDARVDTNAPPPIIAIQFTGKEDEHRDSGEPASRIEAATNGQPRPLD